MNFQSEIPYLRYFRETIFVQNSSWQTNSVKRKMEPNLSLQLECWQADTWEFISYMIGMEGDRTVDIPILYWAAVLL